MWQKVLKRLLIHGFIFGLIILATYQIVKDAATRNMLFIALFSIAAVANIALYELKQLSQFLGFKKYRYLPVPEKDYKFLKSVYHRAATGSHTSPRHFFDYDLTGKEKDQLVNIFKNLHENG